MTLRQRLRNPFVQQYLLEILLPLIGYFFFDWSLLIIAAFYVIDQLASEISFLRKFKAIRKAEQKPALVLLIGSLLLFMVMLWLESFALVDYFASPGFDRLQPLLDELITFAKDELWLLFPLVLVMYYLKDQFTFFMPRRYLQKESIRFFYWHWIENGVIISVLLLAVFIFGQREIPDVILISIFLVLKLTFDFTIVRISDRKSSRR